MKYIVYPIVNVYKVTVNISIEKVNEIDYL